METATTHGSWRKFKTQSQMERSNITQRIDRDEIKEQSTIRQKQQQKQQQRQQEQEKKQQQEKESTTGVSEPSRTRRCSIKCSENFGEKSLITLGKRNGIGWQRTSASTCSGRGNTRGGKQSNEGNNSNNNGTSSSAQRSSVNQSANRNKMNGQTV